MSSRCDVKILCFLQTSPNVVVVVVVVVVAVVFAVAVAVATVASVFDS